MNPATEDDRLWNWFSRIHEMKTGVRETNLNNMRRDQYTALLFEYWLSGYTCRRLDEESKNLLDTHASSCESSRR